MFISLLKALCKSRSPWQSTVQCITGWTRYKGIDPPGNPAAHTRRGAAHTFRWAVSPKKAAN